MTHTACDEEPKDYNMSTLRGYFELYDVGPELNECSINYAVCLPDIHIHDVRPLRSQPKPLQSVAVTMVWDEPEAIITMVWLCVGVAVR